MNEKYTTEDWGIIPLESAASYFDIAKYGRTAKRIIKETSELEMFIGNEYNSEAIKRYCHLHKQTLSGYDKFIKKESFHIFMFLKTDTMIFKYSRFDGRKFHLFYTLEQLNPALKQT